jgi:predicted glycoside hydrolase/deacetylase ChbG (UPF0249 family)
MLIINADDWGKNQLTTDRSLTCFKTNRITSASAMVFMADSERATQLALENNFDTGLHLNFNHKFDGNVTSPKLKAYHQSIASFISKNKYCVLIYHPLLTRQFDYVYKAQYDEYIRLYNKEPTHIDGHQHLHLCLNMILGNVIPPGFKIRKNFTFFKGEKSFLNIYYRKIIDKQISKRYICADYFFDISPVYKLQRFIQIITLSKLHNVELMVHPERPEEYRFLMGNQYQQIIFDIKTGNYSTL